LSSQSQTDKRAFRWCFAGVLCSAHMYSACLYRACLQQQVSDDTTDDTKRLGIALRRLVCYTLLVDDLVPLMLVKAQHSVQLSCMCGPPRFCHTLHWPKSTPELCVGVLSINQSINIFSVLGSSWDPTDNFSSVNSYSQNFASCMQSVP